jgi:hypothetical protein
MPELSAWRLTRHVKMISILANCVNKTVQVSIPILFGEVLPRICQLIGVEPGGVWLESPELARTAFPQGAEASTKIFVPFTQIAYITTETTPDPQSAQIASVKPRSSAQSDAERPPSVEPRRTGASDKKR